MIQKYLLLFVVFFNYLLFSIEITPLTFVDNQKQIGKFDTNQTNLSIGITGFVEKSFKFGFKSIVSYAEIISKGVVKLYPFDLLEQDSLPKGLWQPKKGDLLYFKTDYNRALIIAPNYEIYREIKQSQKKQWVHSDIFSATLNSIGHVRPLKRDLIYVCKQHHIGLLYVFFNDEVHIADCLSLKVLNKFKFSLSKNLNKEVQKPFYSRIKELNPNLFGDGTTQFKDYNKYYGKIF